MNPIEVRTIELRDRATLIPALVIYCNTSSPDSRARRIVARAGWGEHGVILMRLVDGHGQADAYDWRDRTHQAAHEWLCIGRQDGRLVEDGAVVDVRYILGETDTPCETEL